MKKINKNRKKYITNDISVDVTELESKKINNVPLFALLVAVSTFIITVGLGAGFGILNLSGYVLGLPMITALSMVEAVVVSLAYRITVAKSKKPLKMLIPTGGVAILCVIALFVFAENGLMGIINSVISTINQTMAENHIKYVENTKSLATDVLVAYGLIVVIVTLIVATLLYWRKTYVLSVILVLSTTINIWFKGEGQIIYVIAALVTIFAILYLSNIKMIKGSKNNRLVWILVAIIMAASVAFIVWVNYEGWTSVDELRDEVSYRLENIYYGKSDYPEGAFKRFHEYPQKDADTRLEVKMEEGCELHLKGYVGSKYTEKGWSDNDENVYPIGIMEFFYKHRIYPLTQNAFFTSCTWEAKEIKEEDIIQNTIYINNESASQKYQYVTETLDNLNGLVDSKNDVNFRCSFLGKESEYTFTTKGIKDGDYIKLAQSQWYENGEFKTSNQQQFATVEAEYRKFANTKAYMDIPAEEKAILEKSIPECSNNIDDAISVVRSYLKGHIKYSKKCAEYNSDKNYLAQVLLEDKRGFSPHFATIATLMFRYYGIPARYIEGYYVANEIKHKELRIKNDKAHAWVEIYMPGLGFTPVEVTPGFYKEDNQGGGSSMKSTEPKANGGGSGGSSRSKERKSYNQRLLEILIMIAWGILAIMVLVVVVLIARNIVIKHIRNKRLASENLDVRVGAASQYINDMCQATGHTIEEVVEDDFYKLLEKIKFSKYIIAEKDAELIENVMDEKTEQLWKEAKLVEKVKMVVWKGLR